MKQMGKKILFGALVVLIVSIFWMDGELAGPALGVILLFIAAGWASSAREFPERPAAKGDEWWPAAWKRFGEATAPFGEKLADLGDWLIEEEEK